MAIPVYELSHSGTRVNVFGNIAALTDVISIQTSESIKSKMNTATVKFSNPKNQTTGRFKYADIFQPDDELSIKFSQGMVSGNSPVGLTRIMDAQIKEWTYDVDSKGRFLKLKANDIASKLLDFQVQTQHKANDITPRQLIIDTIELEVNAKIEKQAALGTRNKIIVNDLEGGLLTKTKSNGEAFEVMDHSNYYDNKTVRQVIDDMSIDTNTKDGNYLWWVQKIDDKYYLRWEPKSSSVDRQLKETNCISFNPNKSVYNVKNYFNLYCGNDDNDYKITTYAMNINSVAEVGFKEAYFPYPDAAIQAREAGFSGTSLITETKKICNIAGKRRLDELDTPRWKADVTLKGTTDFSLGNNIYLHSEGLGGVWAADSTENNSSTNTPYQGFKLRIQTITQQYSEKGWQTKLDLEEDSEFD